LYRVKAAELRKADKKPAVELDDVTNPKEAIEGMFTNCHNTPVSHVLIEGEVVLKVSGEPSVPASLAHITSQTGLLQPSESVLSIPTPSPAATTNPNPQPEAAHDNTMMAPIASAENTANVVRIPVTEANVNTYLARVGTHINEKIRPRLRFLATAAMRTTIAEEVYNMFILVQLLEIIRYMYRFQSGTMYL